MANTITRIGASRWAALWANIPNYDFADRILDVFKTRQRIRLIVTSDRYWELRILWGLIDFTKGSKREFLIEGGPGLCDAAMRSLEGSKRVVKVVSDVVATDLVRD
jgi:hypothetical protein